MFHTAEGVWPRLQSSHEKPHWIGVDFNHFEYPHDESEEEGEEEGEGKEMDPEMRRKVVSGTRERDLAVWQVLPYFSSVLLGGDESSTARLGV